MVLVSIVQAAWVTRIPKPKLNSLHSQKLETPEILKHKLPEERRKFSLFPKSYMKYVISPEPIYKIATHKPIVHETKKPLMKKLHNLLDKNYKVVENEAVLSTQSAERILENDLAVTPKVVSIEPSEEVSIEIVKESFEKQNDFSKKEDEQRNNSTKTKMVTAETKDKETPNVVEVSQENKSVEPDTTKKSKENESADWTELILVDILHKSTESDKVSTEEPEEFVTTEFYEEPKVMRKKR